MKRGHQHLHFTLIVLETGIWLSFFIVLYSLLCGAEGSHIASVIHRYHGITSNCFPHHPYIAFAVVFVLPHVCMFLIFIRFYFWFMNHYGIRAWILQSIKGGPEREPPAGSAERTQTGNVSFRQEVRQYDNSHCEGYSH